MFICACMLNVLYAGVCEMKLHGLMCQGCMNISLKCWFCNLSTNRPHGRKFPYPNMKDVKPTSWT